MSNESSINGERGEKKEREQFLHTLFWAAETGWAWRRFIIGVTAGVAILAIAISLLLPNWYRAGSRVLPPERSGTGAIAAAMLENLPGAAASIIGGGSSGSYSRYFTILTSRQLLESVIDTFNLIEIYETAGARSPRDAAIEQLLKNTDFEIDDKFDFLSVSVLDKSPERAAEMANFIVDRLNQINAQLSSSNAANYRRYTEQRYHLAQSRLDSALDSIRVFQSEYGVLDISAQSQGFFEQIAGIRAEGVRAEIEYEAMREQLGANNPRVQAAKSILDAAERGYSRALQGAEATLPVALRDMPDVIRRYADLERERILQTRILEVIAPMYEQALFDEERTVEAVQVIDVATPPVLKAKPKRSLIVIFSTMSAFFLAFAFAISRTWWASNYWRMTEYSSTAPGTSVRPREIIEQ